MKISKTDLLQKKQESLEELYRIEEQYVGENSIQQDVLMKIQQVNLTYKWDTEILKKRIAYIDALLEKIKNDPYLGNIIDY
jgi:hypothetical protein